MTPEELIAYFKDKELPKIFSMPGMTITNCKEFVSTHIHRIKEGVPLIAQASYNHLMRFKEGLEK